MKLTIWLVAIILIVGSPACKKDEGASAEDIAKANEFKAFLSAKNFQIADGQYYSDKPIDYETDDAEVLAETDLWKYVSLWIKDDINTFDLTAGQVTIQQNNNKIAGNSSSTIVKPLSVSADKTGVIVNFLNYEYEPLKYHLVEFTADHFLVYADWKGGVKVFTKFAIIQ